MEILEVSCNEPLEITASIVRSLEHRRGPMLGSIRGAAIALIDGSPLPSANTRRHVFDRRLLLAMDARPGTILQPSVRVSVPHGLRFTDIEKLSLCVQRDLIVTLVIVVFVTTLFAVYGTGRGCGANPFWDCTHTLYY